MVSLLSSEHGSDKNSSLDPNSINLGYNKKLNLDNSRLGFNH